MSVVEKELYREALYNHLLKCLDIFCVSLGVHWNSKPNELHHLLLRYLLIKKANFPPHNTSLDPVFMTHRSENAIQQIVKDIRFKNKSSEPEVLGQRIAEFIEKRLERCAKKMQETKFHQDSPITLNGNFLNYRVISRRLTGRHTFPEQQRPQIFALLVRNEYMHLENHGLARQYEKELTISASDRNLECFSNIFNRSLSLFCTCFPDLEKASGSLGSFFDLDLKKFPDMNFQINPPFDETIMKLCAEKVISHLKQNEASITQNQQFIFTFPDWKDSEAINLLRVNSHFIKEIKQFKKGELGFIDYNKKNSKQEFNIIYPCNIIEIVYANSMKP